jgi:diguanylate cyclase (GGDEF)-like protein
LKPRIPRHLVRLSIRRKFSIAFVLLILLPALALGLVTLHVVRGAMAEQAEREQLVLLQAMRTNVVDRHVEDMESALQTLSQEPRLPDIFTDPDARRRILSQWQLTRGLFPERSYIYFGSTENLIIVSPDWEPPEGYDCRERPWYRAARHAFGMVWVDPYEEYVTRDLVMSVATAIYDSDGAFRGVLSIDTFLNGFFRLLRQDAGERAPQVLAVTDRGETLMLNDKTAIVFDLAGHPAWPRLAQLDGGGSSLSYQGTDYYATAVRVPKLRLSMVSLLPEAVLYEDIEPMVWAIIAVTLSFLLLALVAASYFASHFIGNIEQLNGYMRAVESGDYTVRHCVSGRDEFRELNDRLNTMVHHLAQSIRVLEIESSTDPLCGIRNRRFLMESLREEIDVGATAAGVSVSLVDVDHFKAVNDAFGHGTGDEVLRRLSRIMRNAFPEEAIVGRYGGEEFMIVLPGHDADAGADLVDRFRATVESQTWRERGLAVTVSAGVAASRDGDTVESLIHRADEALYRAKTAGRNRVVVSDAAVVR